MIPFGNREISNAVVNTIMGLSGSGDLDWLRYWPSYRAIVKMILEYGITTIPKSSTRHPFDGNYRWWKAWKTIKKVRENGLVGLANAVKLTNDGVEACSHKIRGAIRKGFRVIPSYTDDFSLDFKIIAEHLWEAILIFRDTLGKDFWALEVDGSCSNMQISREKYEETIIRFLKLLRLLHNGVIIFKYGPGNSPEFLKYLENNKLVDAFNGTNAFHHDILFPAIAFPGKESPLTEYGGGAYSGEIIFKPGFNLNSDLCSQLHSPMILGGGISRIEHVRIYENMLKKHQRSLSNGTSFGICSVVRYDPKNAESIMIYLSSLPPDCFK